MKEAKGEKEEAGVTGELGRGPNRKPNPDPVPDAPAAGGDIGTTPPRVRVVVAEDEALIRMDLAEMLVEEGYDVVGQAATGEAAVALVERLRPDVVLLDVRMPVMDGISAADAITSRHDCAVVMLTAFSERALAERAAEAGAAAYLVKPVSAVHLIPAIEVARARRSEAAALATEVESLESRLAARKVIERAKGVLMRDYRLDEAGAFAWLRREAMDRRMSMAEVAAVVIGGDGG